MRMDKQLHMQIYLMKTGRNLEKKKQITMEEIE